MEAAMRSRLAAAPATVTPKPRPDFVETPSVQELTRRALSYLQAGFPVHFRGPAGTGKTTLAMHTAAQLGRPVMLIGGDEQLGTSDLVGGEHGYRYRKVVDRFIHSVLKYEETADQCWTDHHLTTACREGYTLIYDEFTRSRPEANNVLLGALEEEVLMLPAKNRAETYIRVHPDFRAIFTSNPLEYAGVHEAQDALSDRMVTIDVDYYDRDSELAIAVARSGLSAERCAPIVDLVRDFRASGEYDQAPTLRASIMIACVAAREGARPAASDPRFVQICRDVLEAKTAFTSQARERRAEQRKLLLGLVAHHCGGTAPSTARRAGNGGRGSGLRAAS